MSERKISIPPSEWALAKAREFFGDKYEALAVAMAGVLDAAYRAGVEEAALRIGELCVSEAEDRYIVQRMQTAIRAIRTPGIVK